MKKLLIFIVIFINLLAFSDNAFCWKYTRDFQKIVNIGTSTVNDTFTISDLSTSRLLEGGIRPDKILLLADFFDTSNTVTVYIDGYANSKWWNIAEWDASSQWYMKYIDNYYFSSIRFRVLTNSDSLRIDYALIREE